MRQLIVDYLPFEVGPDQINEAMKENNGKLVVKGVLQGADTKNQNGRVYPKEILMREAKKYSEGFVKQKRAMGELDHPESSVVNLSNVSHNITDMNFNGDDLVGTVEILTTPSGNILRELFKNGIKLGISSRGMGSVESVNESGAQEVQDDFELIAFDFVSNPSTHGAFLYPMNESVDNNASVRDGKYGRVEAVINDIMRGQKMPAASKQQQKFMGIVRAIQKGDVPASKFSKAAQKAAKSMKKGSVKKYAATKHDDLPKKVKEMHESMLNENPAVIATAARMAIQNAKGKKVSVNTARQSSYASKDPSAHKKAKSIFQRIKDKFSKKKDDKPKKQSAPTTAADFRRMRKEAVYKFKGMTATNMDELDAMLSRAGIKGTPDFNKMTYTVDSDNVKLDKIMKKKGGKKIKESVNEANNIDKIKDIVKKKQFKRIGGVIIDMQTANAIMKVHKALTGANKKKYEKLSISKMADIAYKLIK